MSGLTERQKEFARGVFEGLSQRVAYKRAYDCTKKKDKTVDELASRLSSNVKVKEYLASLNKEVERSAVLSKQERMEWLSRVVRTPLSKVDADSDLCQEIVLSELGDKIKVPSKIDAIRELNKMDGAYKPTESITTISFDDEAKEAISGIKRKDSDFLPSDEMT
ncbi:MAG: terminase small subunit [Akkermansia sp.]